MRNKSEIVEVKTAVERGRARTRAQKIRTSGERAGCRTRRVISSLKIGKGEERGTRMNSYECKMHTNTMTGRTRCEARKRKKINMMNARKRETERERVRESTPRYEE